MVTHQHTQSEKAAPFGRQIAAQAKVELLLTLRRGESVLITLIVPVLLLAVAAAFYGWRPAGAPLLALAVLAIGTVTFAALGLAMAGALRAEITLAAANGLFLLFLLLGGGILPLSHLPGPLAAIAQILPAAALTQALQATLSNGAALPGFSLLTLAIWAVLILLVAIRTFRWE